MIGTVLNPIFKIMKKKYGSKGCFAIIFSSFLETIHIYISIISFNKFNCNTG